jgi:hypothetical protein
MRGCGRARGDGVVLVVMGGLRRGLVRACWARGDVAGRARGVGGGNMSLPPCLLAAVSVLLPSFCYSCL